MRLEGRNQIEGLFRQAVEMPGEREKFLSDVCWDDLI